MYNAVIYDLKLWNFTVMRLLLYYYFTCAFSVQVFFSHLLEIVFFRPVKVLATPEVIFAMICLRAHRESHLKECNNFKTPLQLY